MASDPPKWSLEMRNFIFNLNKWSSLKWIYISLFALAFSLRWAHAAMRSSRSLRHQPARVPRSRWVFCAFSFFCAFRRFVFVFQLRASLTHCSNILWIIYNHYLYVAGFAAKALLQLLLQLLLWRRQKTKFIKANREKANIHDNNKTEKVDVDDEDDDDELKWYSVAHTLLHAPRPPSRSNVDGILAQVGAKLLRALV